MRFHWFGPGSFISMAFHSHAGHLSSPAELLFENLVTQVLRPAVSATQQSRFGNYVSMKKFCEGTSKEQTSSCRHVNFMIDVCIDVWISVLVHVMQCTAT